MVVLCVVPPMVMRNILHATHKLALPSVLDLGQLGVVAVAHVVVVRVHALSLLPHRLPMVVNGVLPRMVKRNRRDATPRPALQTVLDRGQHGVVVALHVVVVRALALSPLPRLLLMVVKRVVPPMVTWNTLCATPKRALSIVLDLGQLGVIAVAHVVVVRAHALSL